MRKPCLLLISVSGLMLWGVGAMADPVQTAPTTQAVPAAPAADSNKMVCKSESPPTGTRLGNRRICRTQGEWDDIQRQQQQMTSKMEIKGHMGGPNGN